jgi:hypothetical protein
VLENQKVITEETIKEKHYCTGSTGSTGKLGAVKGR